MENLKKDIEIYRKRLHEVMNGSKKYTEKHVIKISKELDELIVKYNKIAS